jgi:glycosyltransferase involved in cell wall biosynthesis
MYESKKHLNSNTHLFASGVDSKHYESACHPETTTPEWMDGISSPRATYVGVIDERMDYELIAQMASAYPEVQFLMCGPVVKVDPAHLPQSPNLHYPGQQTYEDLPRILKGSDVCLMPFAQNDATRYISPTKTLEYMATHRPIVSTSIPDVKRFYSDIVYLADSPEEFVQQIAAAFDEPAHERARRRLREEKILAEQAWDAIADSMETLMQAAWSKTPAGKSQRASARAASLPAKSTLPSTVRPAGARVVAYGDAANITSKGGE